MRGESRRSVTHQAARRRRSPRRNGGFARAAAYRGMNLEPFLISIKYVGSIAILSQARDALGEGPSRAALQVCEFKSVPNSAMIKVPTNTTTQVAQYDPGASRQFLRLSRKCSHPSHV